MVTSWYEKMLIFDCPHHSSLEKSEWSCCLIEYLHFREEKCFRIELVLPSFSFIPSQPQERLSSHAADDQGQARL